MKYELQFARLTLSLVRDLPCTESVSKLSVINKLNFVLSGMEGYKGGLLLFPLFLIRNLFFKPLSIFLKLF